MPRGARAPTPSNEAGAVSVAVSLRHEFGAFLLNVGFEVRDACVTALFGPSGSGKTSIVNAIAGLVQPAKGRIVIGDRVVLDTAQQLFVPPRQRRVGYVFQDARLFPHMTVQKNLLFGWRRGGQKASPAEIDRAIALLALEQLLTRYPASLSGGEKARVALGRALLASPDMLLLDEPLAALDAARRSEILPWLERLRDEARLPMIYVSHSFDEVARLAHEIVVLNNGRVVRQGSVFDLATSLDAREVLGHAPVGTVLDVTLVAQREDAGLSTLAFEGGAFAVSRIARNIGTRLRIRVRAEDIMLAMETPHAISANNILDARIVAIRQHDGAHADVQLICGSARFVARITRASAERLGLRPGQGAFAVIKAVTVDL
jgi:molybdate transport system ATP-binding protein